MRRKATIDGVSKAGPRDEDAEAHLQIIYYPHNNVTSILHTVLNNSRQSHEQPERQQLPDDYPTTSPDGKPSARSHRDRGGIRR
jgi:hypothetical protein